MNKRIAVALILIGVLTAGIFTIVRATALFFVEPPGKQTFEAHQTARQATAEAGPHAPKGGSPVPTRASCPFPTPESPLGLVPPQRIQTPFFDHRGITSEAAARSSAGDFYFMWAGAPEDNPDQGLIRVIINLRDPCASAGLGTEVPDTYFDYLTPKGPLTITQVDGDTIVFSIAGGGIGRFNFVTRQFLP